MNRFKKAIAVVLTCSMVLSVIATAALAYDFSEEVYADNAPETLREIDKDILSGATSAANTTAMSFLGIDVTSTDDAGALNSARDAASPMNLLVFGSDLNENPDPYLWNFYFNLNASGYPGSVYDIDAYKQAGWTGEYTLLNEAKDGPTGSATVDHSRQILINGKYRYCDPVFFYEPDVLMGASSNSYDYGLGIYKLYYNPWCYDPLQLGGWTTSEYCLNDGTFASTAAMANGVYTMSKEIEENYGNEKISRYNGGDVEQCGIDYSNFALGVYYYVQSRLNPSSSLVGKIRKAGYCTGISIAEYGGTITVTNDNQLNGNRYSQYLDGLADLVETGTTYGSYGDLAKVCDLIIMDKDDLTELQITRLNGVGIKVVDIDSILPQTAYGMTMQSADNILGVPYFVGLLYEGRLSNNSESLSEYDYIAYFVENLYHVKNEDVEEVVSAMVSNGCGNGFDGLDRSYNYNNLVNSMIRIGAEYYKATAMGTGNWKAVEDGYFD